MEIIPSRSYIAPCSKSARRFDVGPLLAVALTSLLFLANPRATAHAQTIQPYGSVAGLASWALDFQDEFLGFDSARWTTCPMDGRHPLVSVTMKRSTNPTMSGLLRRIRPEMGCWS